MNMLLFFIIRVGPWLLPFLAVSLQGANGCLRVKENTNGSINKYKAHLFAKAFYQKIGCDFIETLSPIVKPVIVHTLLSICSIKQMAYTSN